MLNLSELQQRVALGLCTRPDCAAKADKTIHKANHLCSAHHAAARLAARQKGHTCAYGVDHWDNDRCCDCGTAAAAGELHQQRGLSAGLYRCIACVQRALMAAPAQHQAVHGAATPRWREGQNLKIGEGICKFCGAPLEWRRGERGKRYPAEPGTRDRHRCQKPGGAA